jgi:hypothetical protein
VAVTEFKKEHLEKPGNTALHALTSAALILPGLVLNQSLAGEGDEFTFQYGHYQEGDRNYLSSGLVLEATPGVGIKSFFSDPHAPAKKLNPIEVDSLATSARYGLSDRLTFSFNFSQDTWAGATPIATGVAGFAHNGDFKDSEGVIVGASPWLSSPPSTPKFDAQGNPIITGFEQQLAPPFQLINLRALSPEITHVMVSASPETRQQVDMQLNYEWDEAALDLGGGVSLEKDYESHFINLGGRWDFNQKLTSISLGGSYTSSQIKAVVNPDANAFTSEYGYKDLIFKEGENLDRDNALVGTHDILHAERQDWSINLGLSQVLYKDAHFTSGVSYTQSKGFLENPYKYSLFYYHPENSLDPEIAFGRAFLEQRPDLRQQFTWDLGYVQYIDFLNGALHLDYQLFLDDWGINAHTFEAEWVQPLGFGFTLAPRVRYYSQSAADFYTPYTLLDAEIDPIGDNDEVDARIFNVLPEHFSSDHRLSGFGTLSYGITLSKEFAKGVKLEGSYEYYMHRGSLKLGGGGEGAYADFDYYAFNAGLSVSLSALSHGGSGDTDEHAGHGSHGGHAPAGLMFAHMLDKAGQVMIGYRYKHSRRHGDVMHGKNSVTDQEIHDNGCGNEPLGCRVKPSEMNVTMHMLSLMYAPTDWMNLMLMPQFVTKSMNMHSLEGIKVDPGPEFDALFRATQHGGHQHESGALGDIGMYMLFKLVDRPHHRLHISFGATAPTGDVDLTLNRVHKVDIGFTHYGLQPGSGTWDLKPGVTYTGNIDDFFWGGQVTGTYRMGLNESGFAFGNNLQASVWGGYQLFRWLSATLRGMYSVEGDLKGEYPEDSHIPIGPMDQPQNYGGKFWDIGMGLTASVPSGDLVGNSLSIEYLQPLMDDFNGYQLEREGTLAFNWSYVF